MSLVFLHVGQCGNQLAKTFWEEMDSLSKPQSRNKTTSTNFGEKGSLPYSLPDCTLPCILVDTEPKVVQRCARALGKRVPKECVFTDKTGRGNNWAYGYHGRTSSDGADNLTDHVVECVRKLMERCDRFTGVVLFHSLAGGTGSGLGSALMERMRDDYSLAYLLSVLVAPFKHGETPLQHYNSLLSLSWTQHYCDAALIFQNDLVLEQTHRQWGRQAQPSERRQESVEEMNSYISKCLCNTFRPLWSPKQSNGCFEPVDMVRSLCPDPCTKFISSVYTESVKATTSWDQLVSTLTRPTRSTTTSSMLFIARGSRENIDSLNCKSVEGKLRHAYNTVKWNPFPVDFWLSTEPSAKERKCASILANSSMVTEYMEGVRERARLMFEEKAYLHWYKKYGCQENVFMEAFETVQTVLDNYST